jgi:hypothetical protein
MEGKGHYNTPNTHIIEKRIFRFFTNNIVLFHEQRYLSNGRKLTLVVSPWEFLRKLKLYKKRSIGLK